MSDYAWWFGTFCQFELTQFVLIKDFPLHPSLSTINWPPHVHCFRVLWLPHCPPWFKSLLLHFVLGMSLQSSIHLGLVSLIDLCIKGEFPRFAILGSDAFSFRLCLSLLMTSHFWMCGFLYCRVRWCSPGLTVGREVQRGWVSIIEEAAEECGLVIFVYFLGFAWFLPVVEGKLLWLSVWGQTVAVCSLPSVFMVEWLRL